MNPKDLVFLITDLAMVSLNLLCSWQLLPKPIPGSVRACFPGQQGAILLSWSTRDQSMMPDLTGSFASVYPTYRLLYCLKPASLYLCSDLTNLSGNLWLPNNICHLIPRKGIFLGERQRLWRQQLVKSEAFTWQSC